MSVLESPNYVIEKGVEGAKIKGVQESLLQESEKDIIFFTESFIGKDHLNFLCLDSPLGPVSVSLVLTDNVYKAIFRTEKGNQRLSTNFSNVYYPWWRRLFGLGPSISSVMTVLSPEIPFSYLKLCKDPNLPNELLTMEDRQVIRSYKFGLLYAKAGQSKEVELFNNKNEETSKEFKEFLNFIGERIELKNWKGYRAGLDVNENLTGTHSVYTKWQGYEIMFHVAPLLPFNETENQQLERKRHIGNDILVVIFQDNNTPIDLDSIDSKQNHIFVVVQPQNDQYRLSFARKTGVPSFSPALPQDCCISKDTISRDFLFHKLVNGERAAYKAPGFAPKIARTRTVLLKDLAKKFLE